MLVVQVETDGGAFVAGIDAVTGVNRWKQDRPRRVNWTSPLMMRDKDGKAIVVLQSSQGLDALAAESGRRVWNYAAPAEAIPSCALMGDRLFVPSRGMTALQINNENHAPKSLWESNQLRPSTASPLALGERIFILNDAGFLPAGTRTRENEYGNCGLRGRSAPRLSLRGNTFISSMREGLAQVVNPNTPEGEVVSELDLGEIIIGTPSISGGALYVRSDGHLWKITGS